MTKKAVIKTGGKQYLVAEGDKLTVEKLAGEAGDKVVFDQVMLLFDDTKTDIGMPIVTGAKVEAEILKAGKGDKVVVFKMKAKKGYRVKKGHRQPLTEVKISKIQ